MQLFSNLLAEHPERRCQVFADDYERARSERAGELAPFLESTLAQAIVECWEAATLKVVADAGENAELLWIEVHRDATVEAVFRQAGEERRLSCQSQSVLGPVSRVPGSD